MASLIPSGSASGTGSMTLAAPVTNSNQTITLPDSSGTVLTTGSPQSGGVIQVVNYQGILNTTTSSSTLATTGFSASITPKFATSKILVRAMINVETGSAGIQALLTIYRGGTNLAAGVGTYMAFARSAGGYLDSTLPLEYYDSPATTSSTTYTIYAASGTNANVVYVGVNYFNSITLMEIAA